MYHHKLHILFLLNASRVNSKGLCPIVCRITHKKKRRQFSTGQYISASDWKAKHKEAQNKWYTNVHLQLIEEKIQKIHLGLVLKEEDYDIDVILNIYNQKSIKECEYLICYFEKFLNKQKRLIGIDIKKSTWTKFHYVKEHTKQFILWKYGKNDLPLAELNLQFLKEFEYYLKTQLKQQQVTINKEIQRLRKPVSDACHEGLISTDPFQKYKPKRVHQRIVFLNNLELQKLENHLFDLPRLNLVKDLFIFSCYTGLPYRELMELKADNIHIGFDSELWIEIIREKTQRTLQIPLLSKPKKLIKKYSEGKGYIFPKISNQKLNKYLKEIATILEIDKRITHHTARKTFASTILLFNNIPMEIVSELLGHSSISITAEYYGKIVKKQLSREMKKLQNQLDYYGD